MLYSPFLSSSAACARLFDLIYKVCVGYVRRPKNRPGPGWREKCGHRMEAYGKGEHTMTGLDFYGIDAIHLKESDEVLPGRLIVIEGTDGVGRSTQLHLLRPWLESSGYAVIDTEMTRSVLVGSGL